MSSFNLTEATLLANENYLNTSLIHEIFQGHQELSTLSMYSGEVPNLTFNILAMAVFFVFTVWQLFLYLKFKNHFYGICMFLYLVGQAIGYLGRVLSTSNISGYSLENVNTFLLQFCSLTISPNFFNAAVYTQYGKLIYSYGATQEKAEKINVFGKRMKPSTISAVFMCMDLLCLIIQGTGGGIEGSSIGTDDSNITAGNNTFIAGLALQTVSMSLFSAIYLKLCYNIFVRQRLEFIQRNDFFNRFNIPRTHSTEKTFYCPWRWAKIIKAISLDDIDGEIKNVNTVDFSKKQKLLFSYYPMALFLAFGLAVIRCIYRLIELSDGGFHGYLITHEHFLVGLDFVPLSASALIMCFFSEGLVFGKRGLNQIKTIKQNIYQTKSSQQKTNFPLRNFFGRKPRQQNITTEIITFKGMDEASLCESIEK